MSSKMSIDITDYREKRKSTLKRTSKDRRTTTVSICKRSVSIAPRSANSISTIESEESKVIVLFDDFDATPYSLTSIDYPIIKTHLPSQSQRYTTTSQTSFFQRSSRKQSVNRASQIINRKSRTEAKLAFLEIDGDIDTRDIVDKTIDIIPPFSSEEKMTLVKTEKKMSFPDEATIILKETETMYLFEMQSVTVSKGTEEGDNTEKDNDIYNFLTQGKGRNRKTVTTEAQTAEFIYKTRHTLAPKVEHSHEFAFASAWDMFDSYDREEKNKTAFEVDTQTDEVYPDKKRTLKKNASVVNIESITQNSDDILSSNNFLDAVIIMERVVANNVFRPQQEHFKDILEEDLSGEENKHHLKLLWTFKFQKTENQPVTAICFNTANEDILAVGYGKLDYCDNRNGLICIWSIKNPTQPERCYRFDIAVSCLAFSNGNPNLLAVGFHNGDVAVLDITIHQKETIAESHRKTSPTYEPIRQILWYYAEDFFVETEQVITISEDGRISRYIQTKADKDFEFNPMMRIIRVEGTIKSVYDATCESNDIPILRNPPCTSFCTHPLRKDIYYIGTADGFIHKCSTNYMNQHINVFYAHDGPVNTMQFSFYYKKIFLTSGADGTVKIWIENLHLPLMTLRTEMSSVKMAEFCPTHSTIIAAISGKAVFIWDLLQKTVVLSTKTVLPDETEQLTNIKFTHNGKNLLITDITGGVHVYTLLGMKKPHSANQQANMLIRSIKDALIIRPDLLKKFKM